MHDGLFEMEESVEMMEPPEEATQAAFTSSACSGCNGHKRAETEDSTPGNSTDVKS